MSGPAVNTDARLRRLNPQLRDAVAHSGLIVHHLALRAGWAHVVPLLQLLHTTEPIAATPFTVARLQRVAQIVGFVGNLFVKEAQP